MKLDAKIPSGPLAQKWQNYIAESKLAGHNDPGAEAVARLFEHLAEGEAAPAGI